MNGTVGEAILYWPLFGQLPLTLHNGEPDNKPEFWPKGTHPSS